MTVILIQLSIYGFLVLFGMSKSIWGISRGLKDMAQDFCPSGTAHKNLIGNSRTSQMPTNICVQGKKLNFEAAHTSFWRT